MIKFFLIVNRHGQTRLAQYYGERPSQDDRQRLESEIVRACVARNDQMCQCFHQGDTKIVYKRYLAIYCIAGVSEDENEFEVISLFDFFFQTLRDYFGDITEYHILYNIAEVYTTLNEIVIDGTVNETSKQKIINHLSSIFV